MIETKELSVALGSRTIIDGFNFKAHAGQLTAIVGPNGSGKTTFFRALCGELPYRGSATLNGNEIKALDPVRAATLRAVLPQATSLAFPFTVGEIVRLGSMSTLSGRTRDGARSLVERALSRVDLVGYGARYYQELSGGEQQRVQLARVLCQVSEAIGPDGPRCLMLDEPVSSLDIRHQLQVMNVARDFAQSGGGVVAILHDLNLAAMFADRIYVVSRGQLAASGRPVDVLKDELIESVFGCRLVVGRVPDPSIPFVLPQSAAVRPPAP